MAPALDSPRRPVAIGGSLLLLLSLTAIPMADAAHAQKKAPATSAETPLGEVRIVVDKKEAKELAARVDKEVIKTRKTRRMLYRKNDKAGLDELRAKRVAAVQELAKCQHKSFVKLLQKVMTKEPDKEVRLAASEALLAQPGKDVVKIAQRELDKRDVRLHGEMAARFIRILSFYGTKEKVWKDLRRAFTDQLGVEAQIALIQHIGNKKDWNGFPLLMAHLGEPAPVDVDSPSNPPAEYWKGRWDKWKKFKPQLKIAMRKLLGRSFEHPKDAKKWIDEQGGLKKIMKTRG